MTDRKSHGMRFRKFAIAALRKADDREPAPPGRVIHETFHRKELIFNGTDRKNR